MVRNKGFTLVELLVVIAIIGILASIVVPRVSRFIAKGRLAKAVSEIHGADLAVTEMLIAGEKKHFGHFFNVTGSSESFSTWMNGLTMVTAHQVYNDVFYELLRQGKNADFSPWPIELKPTVKKKLGTSYLDLGKDPWNESSYQFFAGPLRNHTKSLTAGGGWTLEGFGAGNWMYFRSYRDDPDEDFFYTYNAAAKAELDAEVRGNPAADDHRGFPAPKDIPVYIYSFGANLEPEQSGLNDFEGHGGDDPNNWDNAQGWTTHESYL